MRVRRVISKLIPTTLLAASLLGMSAVPARAQAPAGRADSVSSGKPSVFIDCRHCDLDFLRNEITWIDHVRDRAVADVHVLVTQQTTAAGGAAHTAHFIGLRAHTGKQDTLVYIGQVAESSDRTRRGIANILKLGLVRYAAGSPVGAMLTVTAAAAPGGVQRPPTKDRWNLWVIRARGNGFFNGEKSTQFANMSAGLSANRISEAWKTNLGLNVNYGESSFTFSNGRKFNDYTHSYGATSLLVKSLGPHLSAGQRASVTSSTFLNQRLAARVAPAVEYNLFPYSESTRRQFTVQYSLGVNHFRYEDTTIFNEIEETVGDQTLIFSLDLKQPWGSISSALEGATYLHDLSKRRAVFFTSLDLRLIKGLSLNFSGNAALVRDQLHIAAGGLSDEEVLLRRRQLASSYRYFASFGISYTFGSIYNNIVNSRFGGASGGTVFFF